MCVSILLPECPFIKLNPMSLPIKPTLPKSAATLRSADYPSQTQDFLSLGPVSHPV